MLFKDANVCCSLLYMIRSFCVESFIKNTWDLSPSAMLYREMELLMKYTNQYKTVRNIGAVSNVSKWMLYECKNYMNLLAVIYTVVIWCYLSWPGLPWKRDLKSILIK